MLIHVNQILAYQAFVAGFFADFACGSIHKYFWVFSSVQFVKIFFGVVEGFIPLHNIISLPTKIFLINKVKVAAAESFAF